MWKTKFPSSAPSTQLFAAKLGDGNIIIFDKELNIQQKVKSIPNIGPSDLLYLGNNRLLSCGDTGIEVLDISTTPIRTICSNTSLGLIYSLCEVPHTHNIAAGSPSGDIYILEEKAQIVHTFHTEGPVMCLLWVEKSSKLWAGTGKGYIYILDIASKEQHKLAKNLHPKGVYVLEEGKGGLSQCLLSAGAHGIVRVWNPHHESLLFKFIVPGEHNITSLCFATLDNLLIIGKSEGYVEVWHITREKQTQIHRFHPHEDAILGEGDSKCVGNSFICHRELGSSY